MPRKKAVPKEEPKAMPPAPEAEAPEAVPALSTPPGNAARALAPPQAPEAVPVPPAASEEFPAPSDPPQALDEAPAPSDPPQVPEEAPAPSDPPEEGSDLVDPRDGQTPVEQEMPPGPDGLPAIVTAAKGLNLRAGPGFGFEVLSVVEAGTLLLVLSLPMGVKVPGWALVWLGETAGWVSDKHLRLLTE